MPTFSIERIGNKPVLTGRCIDTAGAIPTIDFTSPNCPQKLPQVLIFQIKPTAKYAFVVGKTYAQAPDGPQKPTSWPWGQEEFSNDYLTVVGYDNLATIWFNLQLKDTTASGRIVTLDPKIKSGGGAVTSYEPLVLLLAALVVALLGFGVGRYAGMRRSRS